MANKKKKKSVQKNVNFAVIAATFAVFAIAMVFVTIYISFNTVGNSKYFDKYNIELSNKLASQLTYQNKIDDKIKDISDNGGYTFDEPFVYNNPYKISPLSSLIIFNTTEEVSVTVSINDNEVTTVSAAKKHIIPIYTLYANATNIVTLTLSTGETKTIGINTDSLNDYIYDYNLGANIGDYKQLFIVGDLYQNQMLRGFDSNNNLIYYLDLQNVTGLVFHKNNYYIGYNSTNSYNNGLVDIKLELDYLGRIISIENNLSELITTENLTIDNGKNYIMAGHTLYETETPNYQLTELIDNNSDTEAIKIATKDLDEELSESPLYNKEYRLAVNGDYISYDFDEEAKDQRLILVNRSDTYAYQYTLGKNHNIKVSNIKEAALYLYLDGKYYNLLATYEN